MKFNVAFKVGVRKTRLQSRAKYLEQSKKNPVQLNITRKF